MWINIFTYCVSHLLYQPHNRHILLLIVNLPVPVQLFAAFFPSLIGNVIEGASRGEKWRFLAVYPIVR